MLGSKVIFEVVFGEDFAPNSAGNQEANENAFYGHDKGREKDVLVAIGNLDDGHWIQ